MKLFASLLALAAASDWPGQHEGDTCGSSGMVAANAVNSTCTMSFGAFTASFVSIAGAFKTADMEYTGFEGISDDTEQHYLIFWEEFNGADGELDNSTCGTMDDVTITCVDNGAANDTPNLVGNYVMDPRQTSFQVPVANHNQEAAFEFDAIAHTPTANVTCGSVVGDGFVCDFSEENGDLAYFGFRGAAGVSNF